MVEMPRVFGQRRLLRRLGFLLLCLAWFSTAAASVCVPHGYSSGASGANRHEFSDHPGNAGHKDDACCILSNETASQPVPAYGTAPPNPESVAFPARDTARVPQPVSAPMGISVSIDPLFLRPPFYLLYNRLLIAAFS